MEMYSQDEMKAPNSLSYTPLVGGISPRLGFSDSLGASCAMDTLHNKSVLPQFRCIQQNPTFLNQRGLENRSSNIYNERNISHPNIEDSSNVYHLHFRPPSSNEKNEINRNQNFESSSSSAAILPALQHPSFSVYNPKSYHFLTSSMSFTKLNPIRTPRSFFSLLHTSSSSSRFQTPENMQCSFAPNSSLLSSSRISPTKDEFYGDNPLNFNKALGKIGSEEVNNTSENKENSFVKDFSTFQSFPASFKFYPQSNSQFNTINFPEKIMCKPKVLERIVEVPRVIYEHKDTYVPHICVREKIVEIPKQVIQHKTVKIPKIEYRENIKRISKKEVIHKIVEVPEMKIVEKVVEKLEKITKEKIVEKIKHIYEEKICHIPKIICQDKIYEVPKIEYKHIEVEKIEEVPEFHVQYEYKDIPITRRVLRQIPVDKIVEVKQQKILEREVKKPIPHYVEIPKYIETPIVKERFIKVEKKIPREVEIMHPVDTYKEVIKPKIITKTIERHYPVHTEKVIFEPEYVEIPVERLIQKPVTIKRCVKQEIEIPYAVYQDALIQTAQGLMPFNEFAIKNDLQIVCKNKESSKLNSSFNVEIGNRRGIKSCSEENIEKELFENMSRPRDVTPSLFCAQERSLTNVGVEACARKSDTQSADQCKEGECNEFLQKREKQDEPCGSAEQEEKASNTN